MSIQPVVVYASALCPYCRWAKALLEQRGIDYQEIGVDTDREKWAEMQQRSGRHTVPQIFFGDRHIGGFDDLSALDRSGGLNQLLVDD